MGNYSIRDLEYLSGIKAHTIRIWEQRYGIIEPQRTTTNIRTYDDADLRKILNISFLNQHGHKISKIAALSYEEILALVDKIATSQATYDTQINSLILSMVNLDEARFHKIIQVQTQHEGFEKTAFNIIFPFLGRVGILWQTGDINPAQEHFISGLIRQKLLVAIDKIETPILADSQRFLLYLPEGEWHELGLLFAYYIIKSRGFKVIYLGQSLPLDDLVHTATLFKPDVIATSITTYPSNQKLIDYCQKVASVFSDRQLIFSGFQVLKMKEELPKSILVMEQLGELIDFMDKRQPLGVSAD